MALRPDGGGVQTYIRELLTATVELTGAALRAVVQADAVDELPVGVDPITRPVSSGSRRALEGLRTIDDADLVHGLDVDLPLRQTCVQVTTVHDLSVLDTPWAFSRYRVAGERLLLSRAIHQADAVIAVSAFTAERVEHHFGRTATVTPLAPAPSTNRLAVDRSAVQAVRSRYGLPERFVLQLAAIEPRKDPALLSSACAKLDIPVVLAGALSGRSSVPAGTRHIGYVDQADIPALLAAADIVAYISRYEGFGLPPIEAMAQGRPVIASKVGALGELVDNGALLVPVGDEQGLVDALRSLWFDDEARAELGRAGQVEAAKLTWTATAEATLEVYRGIGATV